MRIALAYFSGGVLQGWISLIGSVLVGAGLLFAVLAHSGSFADGASYAAGFGIIALVMGPFYSGGAWQRTASTPGLMHLRPHGRRQMLLGATLAVTLVAALFTLGALIETTWPHGSSVRVPFGLPPAVEFRFVWGLTALLWVGTFAVSSRPMLLAFSWGPLVAGFALWDWLNVELSLTVEQTASLLLAIGLAGWIIFALWYLKAPSVLRRTLSGGPAALDPDRWFRGSAARDTTASRAAALRQYLVGAYSPRNCLLAGASVTLVLVIQNLMFKSVGQLPLTIILMMAPVIGAAMAATCVDRARLLWLRAGLNRSALFATTEPFALQGPALSAAVPIAVFVTYTVMQQPALAAAILLHTGSQMAFATCAVYAGLTYTRGAPQIFGLFVVLGVASFLALIKLEPHTVTSPWPHIGALLLFTALALWLRGIAMRSWLRLDWRLTNPPSQRGLQ